VSSIQNVLKAKSQEAAKFKMAAIAIAPSHCRHAD